MAKDQVDAKREYAEFTLGAHSRSVFLRNFLSAIDYSFSGAQKLQGLSGLTHPFEVVGRKGKNILLVVGGAEAHARGPGLAQESPRERMEHWRNKALLSAYDVQSALARDGLIVDLMFFHNICNALRFEELVALRELVKKYNLPLDTSGCFHTSVNPVPILATEELVRVAQSVGACFLSLNDLSIEEISALSQKSDAAAVATAAAAAKRIRLAQYFRPPTDELVLSGYDMSRSHSADLSRAVYDAAAELGHQPSQNAIVSPDVFKDPVATAKELETHKYISFESKTVTVTPDGHQVVQTIRKSAQGSFVIRVLNEVGLPAIAKAIIEAIRGGTGGG